MLRFTLSRIGQAVLVILITTFLIFYGNLYLGNPFASNNEKVIPPQTQAMLREHFGMDEPFLLRYLIYLKNLCTVDLGLDYVRQRPVGELLGRVAPNTALLAVVTVAIAVLIGVAAGAIAAVWQRSFVDVLITAGCAVLLAVPLIVVATALRTELSGLRVFGVEVLPTIPRRFTVEATWWQQVLPPAIALAAGDCAFIARLMRTSMVDILLADYLRTARAKGLPERTVITRHALRNALVPVVNMVAIGFGALLGGTLIVETIFQYNGLGFLFTQALRASNTPIITALTIYSVVAFVVVNTGVDILCAYLDPRIRLTGHA